MVPKIWGNNSIRRTYLLQSKKSPILLVFSTKFPMQMQLATYLVNVAYIVKYKTLGCKLYPKSSKINK
jgi:hypothetical protein